MHRDLEQHSSSFPEQRLENATLNLTRLFFASGRMGRDVEPHLKNIRNRDVVSKYTRAENGFRLRWYSHRHIRRAGGPVGREAETVQSIERQTFEVYVGGSPANKS
jgi:hypothetical protein